MEEYSEGRVHKSEPEPRNLKADPNILVLLTYVSTEIGTVAQRSLYRDVFDQNGMDFATGISLCKTPVVDKKMLILQ